MILHYPFIFPNSQSKCHEDQKFLPQNFKQFLESSGMREEKISISEKLKLIEMKIEVEKSLQFFPKALITQNMFEIILN